MGLIAGVMGSQDSEVTAGTTSLPSDRSPFTWAHLLASVRFPTSILR